MSRCTSMGTVVVACYVLVTREGVAGGGEVAAPSLPHPSSFAGWDKTTCRHPLTTLLLWVFSSLDLASEIPLFSGILSKYLVFFRDSYYCRSKYRACVLLWTREKCVREACARNAPQRYLPLAALSIIGYFDRTHCCYKYE